jgi:hypothetical protein
MKYTSASSVRPNASAVATTPAATLVPANLKPNIRVATPQATYTSIAVPRNSTASFRVIRPVLLAFRHGAMTGEAGAGQIGEVQNGPLLPVVIIWPGALPEKPFHPGYCDTSPEEGELCRDPRRPGGLVSLSGLRSA